MAAAAGLRRSTLDTGCGRAGGGLWPGSTPPRARPPPRGTAGEEFVAGFDPAKVRPAPLGGAVLVGVGLVLLAFRADARERRGGLLALGLGITAWLLPLALSLVGHDFLISKNLLSALVPLA